MLAARQSYANTLFTKPRRFDKSILSDLPWIFKEEIDVQKAEAETFIAGLSKTEKEILLLFLTLSPEKKQEALDMAVSMVNKGAGKCEVHG